MPNEPLPMSPRMMTAAIMGILVLWATYIAVGAYWYNHNPWRGLIVMACMGAFLGAWLLLLWNRKRRMRNG